MTPVLPYRNRPEAGRLLAAELGRYKSGRDVLVLGLARGGLPVAAEVASALDAPLDVLVVRKLGAPMQPELAIGAIAADGTRVLNEEIIRDLALSTYSIDLITQREQAEVERRERVYRSGRPALDLKDRIVILVDDGLATGSTMLAAVRFASKRSPKKVVLAVPVGSIQALEMLRAEVDESVCLATPEWFYALGEWYRDFPQVTDIEVKSLLDQSCHLHAS
jgi:putative phosphoribosyl transferase